MPERVDHTAVVELLEYERDQADQRAARAVDRRDRNAARAWVAQLDKALAVLNQVSEPVQARSSEN